MDFYDRIQNKTLKAIYGVIISIQRFICYFCAIGLPVLVVVQVLLRYVFKAPLMGIEELLSFPIIWLYMLGGSMASEQRNHIECGILTLYIKKEKTMKIFKCCKALFSVIVGIWLARWGFWMFTYSLNLWKVSDMLKIPMFIGESSLFIGFVLMVFFTILELIDYIRDLVVYLKAPQAEGGSAQ